MLIDIARGEFSSTTCKLKVYLSLSLLCCEFSLSSVPLFCVLRLVMTFH